MMMAESRDFRVATYSVLSLIGTERAISILTGMLGGPWACGSFAELLLHADNAAIKDTTASKTTFRGKPVNTRDLKALSIISSKLPRRLQRGQEATLLSPQAIVDAVISLELAQAS
jgi:hypothetical protein